MYAGHLGIAIAATRRRPDIPLSALIAASLAPDLMVFPLWHTLPAAAALVVVVFVGGMARWDLSAGLLLAALVTSHYLADLLTSNLNVWPNSEAELGLGLYDLPAVDFILEGSVIVLGWLAWRRTVPDPNAQLTRPMLILLLVSQALFALFVSAGANE